MHNRDTVPLLLPAHVVKQIVSQEIYCLTNDKKYTALLQILFKTELLTAGDKYNPAGIVYISEQRLSLNIKWNGRFQPFNILKAIPTTSPDTFLTFVALTSHAKIYRGLLKIPVNCWSLAHHRHRNHAGAARSRPPHPRSLYRTAEMSSSCAYWQHQYNHTTIHATNGLFEIH